MFLLRQLGNWLLTDLFRGLERRQTDWPLCDIFMSLFFCCHMCCPCLSQRLSNWLLNRTFLVCLPVRLSVCLSICMSVYFSVLLPFSFTVHLSICLRVCLSACQPLCLRACFPPHVIWRSYQPSITFYMLFDRFNILAFLKIETRYNVSNVKVMCTTPLCAIVFVWACTSQIFSLKSFFIINFIR